jgi:hypothetical protein
MRGVGERRLEGKRRSGAVEKEEAVGMGGEEEVIGEEEGEKMPTLFAPNSLHRVHPMSLPMLSLL